MQTMITTFYNVNSKVERISSWIRRSVSANFTTYRSQFARRGFYFFQLHITDVAFLDHLRELRLRTSTSRNNRWRRKIHQMHRPRPAEPLRKNGNLSDEGGKKERHQPFVRQSGKTWKSRRLNSGFVSNVRGGSQHARSTLAQHSRK